jgi:hypothetical protein
LEKADRCTLWKPSSVMPVSPTDTVTSTSPYDAGEGCGVGRGVGLGVGFAVGCGVGSADGTGFGCGDGSWEGCGVG